MKSSLLITAATCLGLLAAGAPRAAAQASTDLVAGQNTVVGQVVVTHDDDNLYVTYLITEPGWGITETHLEVAGSVADIPQTKKGNPIPGQFSIKDTFEFALEVNYVIPHSGAPQDVVIAAHAVVTMGTPVSNCDLLPSVVNLQVYQDGSNTSVPQSLPGDPTVTDGMSYFDLSILDSELAGWYSAWCGFKEALIAPDGWRDIPWEYPADVFCASLVPDGVVVHPENLGLVQYIINQNYIGTWIIPPDTKIEVTAMDVQKVIWWLLDGEGTVHLNAGGRYVLADVLLNGIGFQPTCGQLSLVVLVPYWPAALPGFGIEVGDVSQPLLFGIPTVCEPAYGSETAWGAGADFNGNNWATYFEYEIQ